MNDANLYDIARDDALLDALGSRRVLRAGEEPFADDAFLADFSAWTAEVDREADSAAEIPMVPGLKRRASRTGSSPVLESVGGAYRAGRPRGGRHAKRGPWAAAGRHSMRAGVAATAVGAALSLSGVAAAVNGGHLPELPSFGLSAKAGSAGRSVLADVPSATATDAPMRPTGRAQAGAVHPGDAGTSRSKPGDEAKAGSTHSPDGHTDAHGGKSPAEPGTASSGSHDSSPAEPNRPDDAGRAATSPRPTTGVTHRTTRPSASEPSAHPTTSGSRSTKRSSSPARPGKNAPTRTNKPSAPTKPKPPVPGKPSVPTTPPAKPTAPTTKPTTPSSGRPKPSAPTTGTPHSDPATKATTPSQPTASGAQAPSATRPTTGADRPRVSRQAVRRTLTALAGPFATLASDVTSPTKGS